MEKEKRICLEYNLQRFAKDGPGGEKTEPATAKRLRDAREEGKVAKSKEISSAIDLIVLFLLLKLFMSFISENFFTAFRVFYNKIPEILDESIGGISLQTVTTLLQVLILYLLKILAPFLLIGLIVSVIFGIVQVGWKVTTKPLKPDLKKFNPVNGFKRIFSKDSLFELVKSIVKLAVIAVVAYKSIQSHEQQLFILYDIPLMQAVILCGNIIIDTGLKIACVYLLVGFADWVYQKLKFKEDMKMTKQEVKDEYKNTEGDPQIKGRQRQRMRESSMRRMMQDVPKADVVITNPTHLAVALKYDSDSGRAPVVVAKGEDYLAQKIKDKAREYDIEIVENKPLARMLYANVDIGAEIPPELYQAVAEVLAMVYNLKNKQ
ncbi:MAG: flagellar biosynthesis protein FlhB [Lachnospiraceae bacterium]|uniref:flagellar biosynthesis protein FlhB n=1 Tax=Roseburia hominis TaxID=301301 RepID=UPI001F1C580A|nr:flagellar biosynthesis protein FlhB [Roseburia hominis]MDD6169995.1 flagellar biosynthesis protein FlhB [Lachnospiraceae bacterium]MDY4840368.1 flagellar biosynthesis protein FlhB [Lachnospiraceae bacterium]